MPRSFFPRRRRMHYNYSFGNLPLSSCQWGGGRASWTRWHLHSEYPHLRDSFGHMKRTDLAAFFSPLVSCLVCNLYRNVLDWLVYWCIVSRSLGLGLAKDYRWPNHWQHQHILVHNSILTFPASHSTPSRQSMLISF